MSVMEELNALCGRLCWRWKDGNYHAGEKDQGAVALVLDVAKAFERVSLSVDWPRRRISSVQGRFCGCYAGTSSTSGEFSWKDVWKPLQTITAILPGYKWSCLLLRIVLQDVVSEVTKGYPHLNLGGACG